MVIAARDAAGVLGAQLDAILAQELVSFELIVADNGSSDGTAALIAEAAARDPRVRPVDASSRAGMTFARNLAAASATGRLLAFTDADDVVAPGWLAALLAGSERTGFAAARLEHERLNPAWTVAWRGGAQTERLVELAHGPARQYAYGTTIAIARELHERIGGWDETLGPSCDMDYCYRVQRDTGAELVLVPEAVVHYRHRASLRGTIAQAISYGTDAIRVQERHAAEWREPLPVLSRAHLLARNARRLIRPDARGGRLAPVRRRADLAAWLWGLGSDVGHRRGAAALARERAATRSQGPHDLPNR